MSSNSGRGWTVVFSGMGINLALGVLYTWSVISKKIPDDWGWSESDRALPYTIACLIFAFMMVPAGKLQDRFGPRVVAALGGLLTGVGMVLAGAFTDLWIFILGFGVLAGTGIGFGYAAATPPAVKWFPPARTGMIAGIVVSGFGLASVYISPLANYLIDARGVGPAMTILGIAFLVVVVGLAQLLRNPPALGPREKAASTAADEDYTASQMLRTAPFYMLWLMYAFNAGAGLMIIGKLAKLVEVQANFKAGFILVALLAIGNAGGRLLAGSLSDKMGRIAILRVFTAFQCVLMFLMPFMDNWVVMVVFSMCMGMNYGSNLSLFPSITKDYYGLKNFGVNYGALFTAWGAGSILALVAGKIYDLHGRFDYALYVAGALLVVTLALSFFVKKPEEISGAMPHARPSGAA